MLSISYALGILSRVLMPQSLSMLVLTLTPGSGAPSSEAFCNCR